MTNKKANTIEEVLINVCDGKDRLERLERAKEALATIQQLVLEAIGEDEDVWHKNPYGQGLNVDGYDGNIRNQFRAKLRAKLKELMGGKQDE